MGAKLISCSIIVPYFMLLTLAIIIILDGKEGSATATFLGQYQLITQLKDDEDYDNYMDFMGYTERAKEKEKFRGNITNREYLIIDQEFQKPPGWRIQQLYPNRNFTFLFQFGKVFAALWPNEHIPDNNFTLLEDISTARREITMCPGFNTTWDYVYSEEGIMLNMTGIRENETDSETATAMLEYKRFEGDITVSTPAPWVGVPKLAKVYLGPTTLSPPETTNSSTEGPETTISTEGPETTISTEGPEEPTTISTEAPAPPE